jgi:hypothetical protein
VKFEFTGVQKSGEHEKKVTGTGVVCLKEGNKVHVGITLTPEGGESMENNLTCDGAHIQDSDGEREAPKNFAHDVAIMLARMGVFGCLGLMGGDEEDVRKKLPTQNFKGGEKSKEGSCLNYQVQVAGEGSPTDVQLCYDPKTWKVTKRTTSSKDEESGSFSVTETYSEWAVGVELSDDLFAHKKDKGE